MAILHGDRLAKPATFPHILGIWQIRGWGIALRPTRAAPRCPPTPPCVNTGPTGAFNSAPVGGGTPAIVKAPPIMGAVW